jgi:hypothetical protein
MLVDMCYAVIPEHAMHVLQGCTALEPHPDLLVTLQYYEGRRDAVTRLLTSAALKGDPG